MYLKCTLIAIAHNLCYKQQRNIQALYVNEDSMTTKLIIQCFSDETIFIYALYVLVVSFAGLFMVDKCR